MIQSLPTIRAHRAISSADAVIAGVSRIGKLAIAALAVVGVTALAPTDASADAIKDTFSKSDKSSAQFIDHSAWDALLAKYVKPGADGLNRVDYDAFKKNDHAALKAYTRSLQKVDVPKLNRNEQFAYWANLYNSVTIDVVLDHYPVKTIRDIDISGLFSNGPWGKKLLTVNGLKLSLNDIEHGIMRPVFKDPRVHYAVNCASIGCPNLMGKAFVGTDLEDQLNASAKAFINSPRGFEVKNGRVVASKIYSWFDDDFGNSEKGVLEHARKYANPDLAAKLKGKSDIYDYQYDWNLNNTPKSSS